MPRGRGPGGEGLFSRQAPESKVIDKKTNHPREGEAGWLQMHAESIIPHAKFELFDEFTSSRDKLVHCPAQKLAAFRTRHLCRSTCKSAKQGSGLTNLASYFCRNS